jgi:hypothetical protein
MGRYAVIAGLVLGFLSVRVGAEGPERAARVLTRVIDAEKDTPYKGILVTRESLRPPEHGFVRATKQRLWHGLGGKFRLEPIEPPELRGNLVVDDGVNAYLVFPKKNTYMMKPSTGSWLVGPMLRRCGLDRRAGMRDPRRPMREFVERGGITLLDEPREIAGRGAFGIAMTPPPPPDRPPSPHDRSPRRTTLWVDKEKFVILGVEAQGPDGKVVDRSEFESIEFPRELDPGLFRWDPPPDMKETAPEWGLMSLRQASRRLGFHVAWPKYTAGYLPEQENAVEIVPFRPRGRRGEDGGIPLAITHFRKDEHLLSIFQSSPDTLAHDIPDKRLLAKKLDEIKDGIWEEHDNSYTWILGDGDERRLLRIQAPPDMSESKVREIAASFRY